MGRGNRKSTIFYDDQDRRQFLCIIAKAADYYALRIFALCLMGTHYHVLLETPERNLSEAMQFVNGVYAQRSNRRYQQTGHVFEARYHSLVVQRETYLIQSARYIVRNPVAAGLVPEARSWRWSTYRATAGLESPPRWLEVDWIRWAFKTNALREARQRYMAYVNAPAGPEPAIALSGIVLGSLRFEQGLLKAPKSRRPELHLGQAARLSGRPTLSELFADAQRSSSLRDRLIYLARVKHGYRLAEVARYLKIERSTASKAAARFLSRTGNSKPHPK